VSGGERRRVSIALELCARPRVLLMDEVTSGLDSHTAHKLVTMLKRIARDHNRIMITAIHQPSQAIFNKMDRLLLLAGGRAVFSGPCNDVEGLLTAARVPRPAEMPMADFLLDLVNEPVQMKAVQQYSTRSFGAVGLDLGEDASVWVQTKLKSQRAPLLYRLGILVRPPCPCTPC
jgi:ATP-binding cassette, subfamily G (WHITE), member 2